MLEKGIIKQPFIGNYVLLAATYSQLGRKQEAASAAENVRRLDPFFETASYGSGFTNPEDRARIITGLRKAGLE